MGSKTRIIILQMKEIIYTVIFAALALLMIFLFVYMFFLKKDSESAETASAPTYTPGVYTASIVLGRPPGKSGNHRRQRPYPKHHRHPAGRQCGRHVSPSGILSGHHHRSADLRRSHRPGHL